MLAKQMIQELKGELVVDEVRFLKTKEGEFYEIFLNEATTNREEVNSLVVFFILLGAELIEGEERWSDNYFDGTTWTLKSYDGKELTIALEA